MMRTTAIAVSAVNMVIPATNATFAKMSASMDIFPSLAVQDDTVLDFYHLGHSAEFEVLGDFDYIRPGV